MSKNKLYYWNFDLMLFRLDLSKVIGIDLQLLSILISIEWTNGWNIDLDPYLFRIMANESGLYFNILGICFNVDKYAKEDQMDKRFHFSVTHCYHIYKQKSEFIEQ